MGFVECVLQPDITEFDYRGSKTNQWACQRRRQKGKWEKKSRSFFPSSDFAGGSKINTPNPEKRKPKKERKEIVIKLKSQL